MKNVVVIAILFVSILADAGETFRVAVPFLPKELKPRDGQLNIGQYIALQVYHPLIVESGHGAWSSVFLDAESSKALDLTFKNFNLCLKKDLKFSDGSQIRPSDLKNSLERFHAVIEQAPRLKGIKVEGENCVNVTLNEKAPRYFSSFQGTASTLIKKETEQDIAPIGLGPYRVKSFDDKKVELEIVDVKGSHRFTAVTFEKVSEGKFDPSSFTDINPVYSYFKGANLDGFKEIETRSFKTYTLVVNSVDAQFRKCVAKALNADQLIENYQLSLKPLPGFLPQGIPGYLVRYKNPEVCKLSSKANKIIMIVPYKDHLERILKNKDAIFGEMAKYIDPVLFDPTEFARYVFTRKPYTAVIAFDASSSNIAFSSEAILYFESLFRENRILTEPIAGLKELLTAASRTYQKQERFRLYEKAHEITLSSSYVIPLGESISKKLFPKNLQKMVIADPLSGYPQINLIQ